MREKRHWLVEILVIALLLGGFAVWKFDLWDKYVAPSPQAAPAKVQPPSDISLPQADAVRPIASSRAPRMADAAKVSAAVQGLIDRKILGPHVAVLVHNRTDGSVLYQTGATTITPASTLKLQTAVAALKSLGEMSTFRTRTAYDPTAGQLTLIGGGDPYLATTAADARAKYPSGGTLELLAQETAQALKGQGVNSVRLQTDETLFVGPAISPDWKPNYVPDAVVSAITSLWADEAHIGETYAQDPALQAGQKFRAQLAKAGIAVTGAITKAAAPTTLPEIAHVDSAPVGQIVQEILSTSDNQAAEVLARHVGLKVNNDPSFRGGAGAVQEVLRGLGIDTTGNQTYDGSGLSRSNLVSASSLAATLEVAASNDHPGLRSTITGAPVAGFTGSLKWRFDNGPADALGRVRAKTGTLTGVHGLAGLATDADGSELVFVLVADRVGPQNDGLAQAQLDKIAGALGACRCGVGSAS